MKLSPLDIEHVEFSAAFGGYSKKQVRDFLERVASRVEDLEKETERLRDEAKGKDERIGELQAAESELKRAVIAAERIGTEMKQNAKREAELLIKEAEHTKGAVVRDAETRMKEARFELSRIEKEYQLFREQFRGMLRAFERSLDSNLITSDSSGKDMLDSLESQEHIL